MLIIAIIEYFDIQLLLLSISHVTNVHYKIFREYKDTIKEYVKQTK